MVNNPEYAVHIENQSYTWGVQTVDIDEMFDNMIMEMKGETTESRNKRRTEQQILEAEEKRIKKEKDMA